MRNIRVAAVQFQHVPGNKTRNLERVWHFATAAARAGVEIIAFPEMCLTGYWHVRKLPRDAVEALAEPVPDGPSTQALLRLSQDHGLTIGAGLIERGEDGRLYNAYDQRPDAGLPLDSTRTALGGDAEELKVGKVAGEHLLFESAYSRRSPGFEINDEGYIRRADQQTWVTWMGLFDRRVRKYTNRMQFKVNWLQQWTASRLAQDAAFNTNTHITFRNNWSAHAGVTAGQLGATYDDRAARGGPAVRQDMLIAPWFGVLGDDRRTFVPGLFANLFRGSAG